ncbi:MAG: 13E12 repeat family protein, partial [Acidimicrobiia bacterium]|nr:13E12 repeat family protein [Acidimicrobiia bacterium]
MFEGLEATAFDDEVRPVEAGRWGAGIPVGLDGLPAGPFLAALLSSIDVADVSGHDRVVVLRARQRMVSHYQAQVYADMVAVSDFLEQDFVGDLELATDATAAEIRAALCLTRRAADHELDVAVTLRDRLPNVWAAFNKGDLDAARAKTIVRGTEHLSESAARQVADLVLVDAVDLTTGQIAA